MCLHLYHFFSNQIHRSVSPNWKKVWHWLLQWSWISHNKRPWWGKKIDHKKGIKGCHSGLFREFKSKFWAFLTCNLEYIKILLTYYSREMMIECTCPWYDQTVILLKRTMKKSLMQIIHWWKLSKSTTWNPYNGQKIARPIFSQKNLA